ncbi:putative signal transducing protein [Arcticibacterium luteifluviistationis]|uniref:DUF2007 domain-containing protein n=1 Tax=Arcticibacterium luteifluviistationis TaxID=1784714 RepID=A0A2Z4GGU3_9BACT|nr:DUF2007 domain-containing protein [Arcticibacterium luteifluviistationis]AWW00610.1 hypothetical protein DJ013_21440 [Arcticibacterium luteifluviistationis]
MILSTESDNWQIVYKTENAMQAELLKNDLENNEIKCFIVNKKDTMYPIFGANILYTQTSDVNVAKVIIEVFLNKNESEIE